MEKLQFKTTINCMGCVNSVSPFLSNEEEIKHWTVDIKDPNKTLTVLTDLKKEEVQKLVEKAGFQAESL
jgi:copper chaperone CopZ